MRPFRAHNGRMPLKIAILHYADVRNFGDVLFPLLVARELGARLPDAELRFINASGASWAGIDSVRLDRADLNALDALILGGGEVVHRLDDMLGGIYARFGLQAIARPTDLVFAWTHAPVRHKVWIGLGVPEPAAAVQADIRSASTGLTLLTTRGSLSHERLLRSGVPAGAVRRSPDLGWLFPRLLQGRVAPAPAGHGQPYMVVQALGFEDPVPVAHELSRFAQRHGLRVVLLPLTRCWDDVEPLRRLNQLAGGAYTLVDDDTSDLDKLAILGGAVLQVGQSMHGFIGTMAQNRPAGLVMPRRQDKFTELLEDNDWAHLRCSGWDGLDRLLQTLLWTPPALIAATRRRHEQALDSLFDELCTGIAAGV